MFGKKQNQRQKVAMDAAVKALQEQGNPFIAGYLKHIGADLPGYIKKACEQHHLHPDEVADIVLVVYGSFRAATLGFLSVNQVVNVALPVPAEIQALADEKGIKLP